MVYLSSPLIAQGLGKAPDRPDDVRFGSGKVMWMAQSEDERIRQ